MNLVIFHTDQQRFDSLGCYGNQFARTPHIDALAAEGRRYTRHFVANPVCMPSRASLMSGLYPTGHGVWSNGIPLPRREFVIQSETSAMWQREMGIRAPHIDTLADTLLANGYRTHSVGKQHLTPTESAPEYGLPESRDLWEKGSRREWSGPYCGFETLDMSLHHGENVTAHYRYWLEDHAPELAATIGPNARKDSDGATNSGHALSLPANDAVASLPGKPDDLYPSRLPASAHSSTWCGDRAAEFLHREASSGKPFFLWVGFPDPHHPWTPPAETVESFIGSGAQPAHFDADRSVSPGLRGFAGGGIDLRARGADEFTAAAIREFTNAQIHLIDEAVGRVEEKLRETGTYDDTLIVFTSDHGDFLGDFGLIRKAGVATRVLTNTSLIIRVPGESGTVVEGAVSNTDVAPTILDLLGVDRSASGLPGAGSSIDGVSVAAGVPDDHVALVQCFGHRTSRNLSVVDGRYRLTWYPETDEVELYDHEVDPYELENVAGADERSEVVNALMDRLRREHMRAVSPISGHLSPW